MYIKDNIGFSVALKNIRELRQISRQEICKSLDLSYRTYEHWERGERVPPLYVQKLILSYIQNM